MALWQRAQQLPHNMLQQIRSIYGDHFPIEIRHTLATWIEEKFLVDIEQLGDSAEQYVISTISALFHEIEAKANTFTAEEYFLTRLKLIDAVKQLRLRYQASPMTLFNYIQHCLHKENQLVAAASGECPTGLPQAMAPNGGVEIMQQVEVIRHRVQRAGEDLKQLEHEREAFTFIYEDCMKMNASLQEMTNQPQTAQLAQNIQNGNEKKRQMQQQLNEKFGLLVKMSLTLLEDLRKTVELLNTVQTHVVEVEMVRWKRAQQMAGNGAVFHSNLDSIQEWCEWITELNWTTRQHAKEVERHVLKLNMDQTVLDQVTQLIAQVTQMLSTLVTSTFVIEKQPPQVMKTNTRFTSTVRLLVGAKLNVHMAPPQVRVTIVSEAQANMLLKTDCKAGKGSEASGEILNNTGMMEYQQTSRQLSASFRNMQLKKIKRAEKKGTESVMDEKFSLYFQAQFSVGGGELNFNVWTLSLPVVVIVHGNQEPHAWATVTWDNAFSEPGRAPFTVPDKVPWIKVAETLSLKFTAQTGRPLTEDNLHFLADKAFRGSYTDMNQLLSWSQFCKEPLTDRNFTFWEWFYAIMKLTREHLRGPWNDNLILGFIRKRDAEEMLIARHLPGSFLLRFSDSELGGVTIAWINESEVFNLQPFTAKDFAIRSLADRVKDLVHLTNLYPDRPKDHVFFKYYTQETQQSSTTGYVRPLLKTHVDAMYTGYPNNTPNHSTIQSPDTRDTPSVVSSYAGEMMEQQDQSQASQLPPAGYDLISDQFCNFDDYVFNT